MKWIKHDTDANQDAKLQNVLLDYGLEGYGLYWYCIELIAGRVDKDNITFELEHDARIIARNVGSTAQKVEEMMRYFVSLGLFEDSHGTITCLKLARRLDKSMTSNPEMRSIIENLKLQSHDSIMTESEKPMQDKIRLDQKKTKKETLDWSATQMSESEIKEIKQLRKNAKSPVTQRVIDQLAKQFELSRNRGYSNADILNEWSVKGWRAYKDDWMKVPPAVKTRQPEKQECIGEVDRQEQMDREMRELMEFNPYGK